MGRLLPRQILALRMSVRIYNLSVKIREKRRAAHKINSYYLMRDLKKKFRSRLLFFKNCALQ